MSLIKTKDEIEILREGGKRLARVLEEVARAVKPGVKTSELDSLAYRLITEGGDGPAFLNYRPAGVKKAFPATLCVSIDDEVVHGIPKDRELKEGEIVGLDLGLKHSGLFVDMAVTVGVGQISDQDKKLIADTKKALEVGVSVIRNGKRIGDVGYAIESFAVPLGYGIVYELGGHGVGHAVHEKPHVPNFGEKDTGEKLKEGVVLAIEPMLTLGVPDVVIDADGSTFKTRDGKKSAHFEVTVVVTKTGVEILTK